MATEKAELGHLEAVNKGNDSSNQSLQQTHTYDEYLNEFTEEEGRKIIHRVDRRLVTVVGIMYCISLMDRTNLGAAVIAGYAVERLRVLGAQS